MAKEKLKDAKEATFVTFVLYLRSHAEPALVHAYSADIEQDNPHDVTDEPHVVFKDYEGKLIGKFKYSSVIGYYKD